MESYRPGGRTVEAQLVHSPTSARAPYPNQLIAVRGGQGAGPITVLFHARVYLSIIVFFTERAVEKIGHAKGGRLRGWR